MLLEFICLQFELIRVHLDGALLSGYLVLLEVMIHEIGVKLIAVEEIEMQPQALPSATVN